MTKAEAEKELKKVRRQIRLIEKKPDDERVPFLDAMLYAKAEGLLRIIDSAEDKNGK